MSTTTNTLWREYFAIGVCGQGNVRCALPCHQFKRAVMYQATTRRLGADCTIRRKCADMLSRLFGQTKASDNHFSPGANGNFRVRTISVDRAYELLTAIIAPKSFTMTWSIDTAPVAALHYDMEH